MHTQAPGGTSGEEGGAARTGSLNGGCEGEILFIVDPPKAIYKMRQSRDKGMRGVFEVMVKLAALE